MRLYILLLLLIKVLLSFDAPALPPKQGRYLIKGNYILRKPQSITYYKITSYKHNGKSFYICADKTFQNYGKALKYCQCLSRYGAEKRGRNSWRTRLFLKKCKNFHKGLNEVPSRKSPTVGKNYFPGRGIFIKNPKKDLDKNVIGNEKKEFSIAKKMNTKSFTFYIWKKVWVGCNVVCYRSNHFGKYKSLILEEINNYRSNHRGDKLVPSFQLNNLAQNLANNYAKKQKLYIDRYAGYGILYANVNISLATIIIKSLYDTKSKYSFYFNRPFSREALCFAQIVWSSTQKIGIGVQQYKNNLYVVLLFYPKVSNKKEDFTTNVFKRVRKTFL
uniref:CAP domain-containing protein (inferred by orthology to a zebrafish protein) n=1 Tax=Strongyloides venezuelensis TaxID=75913 RepID=A0A0K0FD15_STRVS